MLGLIDEIRTLQWQFAGANPEHVPQPTINRLRQAVAQRELAKEAEKQPEGVTDIRTKKSAATQRKPKSKPSEIRARLAHAQATNQ